jgi:prepilin-type N-terminal cleavage/methylation domain-containing protein
MSPYKLRHRAFTLIELLIVITIIGILAVALIPRLTGGPSRARDAQRKSDLQQFATALEFYANDHSGGYPNTTGCTTTLFGSTGTYPLTGYMTTIPSDPSDLLTNSVVSGACGTAGAGGYGYIPLNTTGTTASGNAEGYLLVARSESTTELGATASGGIYYVSGTAFSPTVTGSSATATTNLSAAAACTSAGTCTSTVTRYYMVGH